MKLPYATKYNGVYYQANVEIPCEEPKKPETKIEEKPEIEVKAEKRKTTSKK